MKTKAVEYTITAKKQEFESVKICSSEDAVNFARNFYHDDMLIYESSFIILTNASNKTIGYSKISQGGVCGTVVDARIVAKYAVDSLAAGVIFIHNHPSGNVKASRQDITLTEKLKAGLKLLDVNLTDSIILTEDGYMSMVDEGII